MRENKTYFKKTTNTTVKDMLELATLFDGTPASANLLLNKVPRVPSIAYYNDKDELLYVSDNENVYTYFRLLTVANNLHGYYCTVETEWYDSKGEYQGNAGGMEFEKYYFNADGKGAMSDFPSKVFMFPFDCLMDMSKGLEPGKVYFTSEIAEIGMHGKYRKSMPEFFLMSLHNK